MSYGPALVVVGSSLLEARRQEGVSPCKTGTGKACAKREGSASGPIIKIITTSKQSSSRIKTSRKA